MTINNIPVENGQCCIDLYAQHTAGGHFVTMDNVQLFQQYSSAARRSPSESAGGVWASGD